MCSCMSLQNNSRWESHHEQPSGNLSAAEETGKKMQFFLFYKKPPV